jgi:non-specific serine/threonine protein kinase
VDLLGTLVEKSIVKRDLRSGNAPRYSLLDTIRQYGRQRLREIHDESRTRSRHLEWITGLAKSIGDFDSH